MPLKVFFLVNLKHIFSNFLVNLWHFSMNTFFFNLWVELFVGILTLTFLVFVYKESVRALTCWLLFLNTSLWQQLDRNLFSRGFDPLIFALPYTNTNFNPTPPPIHPQNALPPPPPPPRQITPASNPLPYHLQRHNHKLQLQLQLPAPKLFCLLTYTRELKSLQNTADPHAYLQSQTDKWHLHSIHIL